MDSVRTKEMVSRDPGVIQPVIVHAILDQKGKVLDAEVVQTPDPALVAAAFGVVWHSSRYMSAEQQGRPLQSEAFINVKFTPPSQVRARRWSDLSAKLTACSRLKGELSLSW